MEKTLKYWQCALSDAGMEETLPFYCHGDGCVCVGVGKRMCMSVSEENLTAGSLSARTGQVLSFLQQIFSSFNTSGVPIMVFEVLLTPFLVPSKTFRRWEELGGSFTQLGFRLAVQNQNHPVKQSIV